FQAKIRCSADGGTNVLFTYVPASHSEYLPHFIAGDFDSIAPIIKEFYQCKGCDVFCRPDQDNTDFTKCLNILLEKVQQSNSSLDCIIAHVGASQRRFDHQMANINTLYRFSKSSNVFLFIIMCDNVSFILPAGEHEIDVDSALRGKWCSLVPIGSSCTVTTNGLTYNMTNSVLEFGELVSTSNGFDGSPAVKIQNDRPVLWSMGIKI
ncbi:hypothetical protein HELRODRAFT_68923, partial [Helobdella robusta]|uniref:Thiamine pyrophosphokinase 1 n=1 Tax=Helobdella robusta TaxID=6412 RepID=T1FZL7_HELRO